jgi:uncharacterized spore protein YtfJ
MRRPVVVLSIVIGAAALSVGFVAGCGGNDKPPLTPDMAEPLPDGADAGASSTPPAPPK